MRSLSELFVDSIKKVLQFKIGLEVYEHSINDKISNFRDFEAELDETYLIKGTEVKFNQEVFEKWETPFDNNMIVNEEKDMASMDITDELASNPFRYKEMTLVYLFAILEDFGNSIIEIVNIDYFHKEIEQGRSWHSKINQNSFKKGKDIVEGFCTPFNLQKTSVYEKFVILFYELKLKRNRIAHELKYPQRDEFKHDVTSIILLICYLYFINEPNHPINKFYPWEDYNADD